MTNARLRPAGGWPNVSDTPRSAARSFFGIRSTKYARPNQ